jgi:hypothetical protein
MKKLTLISFLIKLIALSSFGVLFPTNFAKAVLAPFYCRGGYSTVEGLPVQISPNGTVYYSFTWAYQGKRWEPPPWGISGTQPPKTCVWGDRGGWAGEPTALCFSMSTPGAVQFIESLRDPNKITPIKILAGADTGGKCFVVDQFGSFELTPEGR